MLVNSLCFYCEKVKEVSFCYLTEDKPLDRKHCKDCHDKQICLKQEANGFHKSLRMAEGPKECIFCGSEYSGKCGYENKYHCILCHKSTKCKRCIMHKKKTCLSDKGSTHYRGKLMCIPGYKKLTQAGVKR